MGPVDSLKKEIGNDYVRLSFKCLDFEEKKTPSGRIKVFATSKIDNKPFKSMAYATKFNDEIAHISLAFEFAQKYYYDKAVI